MKTKDLVIGAVIMGLIVVVGSYFGRPSITVNVPEQQAREDLGATPGAEISGDYFAVGGVNYFSHSESFINASTTGVSIISPAATTSIVSLGVTFTSASSTGAAHSFDIGTTTRYTNSTTSPTLGTYTIANNTKPQFTWSPAGGAVQDGLIPPNTKIIMRWATSTAQTYTGYLKVLLQVL